MFCNCQSLTNQSGPCSKALGAGCNTWHVSLYLAQEDVGREEVGLELVRVDAQHISDLELCRLPTPGQVVGVGQQQVRLQKARTVVRQQAQHSAEPRLEP